MGPVDGETARVAFARGDWAAARAALEREQARQPLAPDDLELLGRARWWLGDTPGFLDVGRGRLPGPAGRRRRGRCGGAGARPRPGLGHRGRPRDRAGLAEPRAQAAARPRALARARLPRLRRRRPGVGGGRGPRPGAWRAPRCCGTSRGASTTSRWTRWRGCCPGWPRCGPGAPPRASVTSTRRCSTSCRVRCRALWCGDIFCTVIHLCRTSSATGRGCVPGPPPSSGGHCRCQRTFMYTAVTRVHQLELAGAQGEWDRVEREMAEPSEELVGSHGWVAGAGFHGLRRGQAVARRPRRGGGGLRTQSGAGDRVRSPEPRCSGAPSGGPRRPSPPCGCRSRAELGPLERSRPAAADCPGGTGRGRRRAGADLPRSSWSRLPPATTRRGCGPGRTTPLPASCCTEVSGTLGGRPLASAAARLPRAGLAPRDRAGGRAARPDARRTRRATAPRRRSSRPRWPPTDGSARAGRRAAGAAPAPWRAHRA